jgi:DNA-binding MurR/RpiR family transcriptional regulator
MSRSTTPDQRRSVSIHALVRAGYALLAPTERRVADLILNFPGELSGYSASELARMAKISNATVTRFVRRLGFQNYEEMRRHARAEREAGAPLYLLDGAFADPDNGFVGAGPRRLKALARLIDRHADTAAENLRSTFTALDRTGFSALADAIAEARQVWIVGFRHGHFLAGYLRWSLAHARPNVRMLPNPGETIGESFVDFGKEDVLFAFALRRRVPLLGKIIKAARAAGARVALATDPGMTDTFGADWVLRCASRTNGPIDDHVSALALAHIVTEQIIVRLGAQARSRLGQIDDIHGDLSELAP